MTQKIHVLIDRVGDGSDRITVRVHGLRKGQVVELLDTENKLLCENYEKNVEYAEHLEHPFFPSLGGPGIIVRSGRD